MNADVRTPSRFWAGAVLVAALLAALLATLLAVRPVSTPDGTATLSASGGSAIAVDPRAAAKSAESARSAESVPVVLRVGGGGVMTATLDDTPTARQFAAMLPLRLDLHDPMGQAKSGRLARAIDVSGADRVVDPRVGEIYYWPPSGDIAIFYADLDQSVPAPGLVRLGVVGSGLDAIASAGNRSTVWIDRTDRIGS
jgi:hypothetical protein